jgi:hypothetical protein
VQNQIAFTARMVEIDARMSAHRAEIDARMAETDRINAERFARIETILLEHSRILKEHSRSLEALPDAIRERSVSKVPRRKPRSEHASRLREDEGDEPEPA